MKNSKKTKKETRINNRKDNAFSSLYSIISFFSSLIYLLFDLKYDDRTSAKIALLILFVSLIICKFSISKLSKTIESDDARAKKIHNSILEFAKICGYLSFVLLAITLISAMFV